MSKVRSGNYFTKDAHTKPFIKDIKQLRYNHRILYSEEPSFDTRIRVSKQPNLT